MKQGADHVSVTVTIDTEEDNWGSYAESGETTRNIGHLDELHEAMARWDVRPTYLVNRSPLVRSESVEVLGRLAARPEVEIGGHCHPWNTPPFTGEGSGASMMCQLPVEANRGKIAVVTSSIERELGVRPQSFRTGRWGFGPSVSEALAAEGYSVDASVTPLLDWSDLGGPDCHAAPRQPYHFHPERPFTPDPSGRMVEIPTTIGYLRGNHRTNADFRRAVERSALRHLKIVAVLEIVGAMRRRWLSPESSSGADMVRLIERCVSHGDLVLDLTFHSCTLLPGATPFVRDEHDRKAFFDSLGTVLRFCRESGFGFRTLREVAAGVSVPD